MRFWERAGSLPTNPLEQAMVNEFSLYVRFCNKGFSSASSLSAFVIKGSVVPAKHPGIIEMSRIYPYTYLTNYSLIPNFLANYCNLSPNGACRSPLYFL